MWTYYPAMPIFMDIAICKMNNDTKRKISMRLRHRNKTATHKWHISRAMKNHPVNNKTKEKISASLKAYYEKKRAASTP